ncbi:BTB/POZ domain-containing protein At3g50780-like [Nymphaea colorata]|nr:BTB/POZ domain-containing protein At3g50780-like [Nymphaea colorata]
MANAGSVVHGKATSKVLEEANRKRIRLAPVAVAPSDSLWCCPFPAVSATATNRAVASPATASQQSSRSPAIHIPKTLPSAPPQNRATASKSGPAAPPTSTAEEEERVTVGFGEIESRDLQLTLSGKQGLTVRLRVHKQVLIAKSSFFRTRLSGRFSSPALVEIRGCGDVEMYLETIGLMYSKDLKRALLKHHSLQRVLRILKVSNSIGFHPGVYACLVYMEAVPWVGEEEEQQVVAAVRRIRPDDPEVEALQAGVLRRLGFPPPFPQPPPDQPISQIIQLLERATHDRARTQTQSLLSRLLLLKPASSDTADPTAITEALHVTYHACMHALLVLFVRASDAGDAVGPIPALAARQAEHLLWVVGVLAGRRAAGDVVAAWSEFGELAGLQARVSSAVRRSAGRVTARLCVAIGKGEAFASSATRCALARTWLGWLMEDSRWVVAAWCGEERAEVEEGVCRTVLTLPVEEQGRVLMEWAAMFCRVGRDGCLDLRAAFEIWWKRAFTIGNNRQR